MTLRNLSLITTTLFIGLAVLSFNSGTAAQTLKTMRVAPAKPAGKRALPQLKTFPVQLGQPVFGAPRRTARGTTVGVRLRLKNPSKAAVKPFQIRVQATSQNRRTVLKGSRPLWIIVKGLGKLASKTVGTTLILAKPGCYRFTVVPVRGQATLPGTKQRQGASRAACVKTTMVIRQGIDSSPGRKGGAGCKPLPLSEGSLEARVRPGPKLGPRSLKTWILASADGSPSPAPRAMT